MEQEGEMSDQIEIEEYDCEVRLLTEEEQKQMEALEAQRRKASIPLYDVAPVRHGRWINLNKDGDSRFMCSCCLWKEYVPTCNGEPTIWDYCPNCGARMDVGQE